MTPKYRVTALKMGTLLPGKPLRGDDPEPGRQSTTPIWCAAIEGNGQRIVVDTGIADLGWVRHFVCPCARESDETIDAALRQIGWEPQDVNIVINTHLHYDHCGGNALFPNARFYVTALEWEHAAAPIKSQQNIYDRVWLKGNLDYHFTPFAAGQFDLLPGIKLILTPGHTPGHQSVLVDTEEGVLAITGDALRRKDGVPPWGPPRILHTPAVAIASADRIRASANRVLTAHDSEIVKYQNHSFPVVG